LPITKSFHSGQHESDGRDEGRDVGGIKNIPPMLKPLYTKAFPKI